jgi:tRNA-splicing ligase RtcB (3'-phosphate/5'-hydroxy nucleic acid ligase)
MIHDSRLVRLDANRTTIQNPHGIPATLFANDRVPIEAKAVTELLELLELQETVERFQAADPASFDVTPEIARVAITPDFHKAQGIPVGTVLATRGFVVPQAIGNDINCGMRLHTTSLSAERVMDRLDDLETALRRVFFEAGRNIPMSRTQREAMFTGGLHGLLESVPPSQSDGLWALWHELGIECDLERTEQHGSVRANRVVGLEDALGRAGVGIHELTRDAQIGSVGGGNHFVEVQRIERVLDRATAHAWGLREGQVTVMVHTGSLGVGHASGSVAREAARAVFPTHIQHPRNKIFVLPTGERHRDTGQMFWDAMANAANFAFTNRLMLGLMTLDALRGVIGDTDFPLVYDAPHNLVWREDSDAETTFVHRKGATTARGLEAMQDTPFAYYGEPVLVPGSMGSSSFVLAGLGHPDALQSASHGAGRALSRGDASRGFDTEFEQFLESFRVVTPLDLRRADVRSRPDILAKKLEELKQEGPHAYKGIGPIIETLSGAGMARPVVELRPVITVKG